MKTKRSISRLAAAAVAAAAFLAGALIPTDGEAARSKRPSEREAVKQMIVEEAMKTIVPPTLALAVGKVESNFNPRAESHVGARGVMQIMPKTARTEFGVFNPDELWDARTNIRIGVTFLERLYHQYGRRWDFALSHYNGGTLKKKNGAWRAHGYTRKYVTLVQNWQAKYERNNTAVAMVAKVDSYKSDRGRARFSSSGQDNYWMAKARSRTKYDWRHYLNVADRWMAKPKAAAAQAPAEPAPATPEPAPVADAAPAETLAPHNGGEYEDEGEWTPIGTGEPRPSDALQSRIENLKGKFRSRLGVEERDWKPVRSVARRFL